MGMRNIPTQNGGLNLESRMFLTEIDLNIEKIELLIYPNLERNEEFLTLVGHCLVDGKAARLSTSDPISLFYCIYQNKQTSHNGGAAAAVWQNA